MSDARALPIPTGEGISRADRDAAKLMGLRSGPRSPRATLLIDRIVRDVLRPAGVGENRPSSALKARKALGAILADLADFEPQCGSHAMSKSAFPSTTLGFGLDIFQPVVNALRDAGLLLVMQGQPRWQTWRDLSAGGTGENVVSTRGRVTRFRLTALAYRCFAEAGVDPLAWEDHWAAVESGPSDKPTTKPQAVPPVGALLTLKPQKRRMGPTKDAPPAMYVDETLPEVRKHLEALGELNAYLSRQAIGGISFRGLRRVFNDGDVVGKAWRRGGRFYTVPGGVDYIGLPHAKRVKRIKLDGESVAEVDISACQLMMLYGLLGSAPVIETADPYALPNSPDIPRSVVKDWVKQALGNGNCKAKAWFPEASAAYRAATGGKRLGRDFPIAKVAQAVLGQHPVLMELEERELGSLDLTFHEAEVVQGALKLLRDIKTVPALPMHDAVIVPQSYVEDGKWALSEAFNRYFSAVTGSPPRVGLQFGM